MEPEPIASISFENTMEDAIACNKYYYSTSQAVKIYNRWRYLAIVLMLGVAFINCLSTYGLQFAASVGAGMALLVYSVERLVAENRVDRMTKKGLTGMDAQMFLTEKSVQIYPDGFTVNSKFSETKFSWATLEYLENTNDLTILVIGHRPIVIPHNRLESGDYKQFMAAISKYYHPETKLNDHPPQAEIEK